MYLPLEINTINSYKSRKLQKRLFNYFAPYYASNNKGHQINHAIEVCSLAYRIAGSVYPGKLDGRILSVAAFAHDMYSDKRDTHHLTGAEHILSSEFRKHGFLKSDEEYELAAAAVREHRASFKGESYTSQYSEVISAADRGSPDLDRILKRVYSCNMGGALEDNLASSLKHLHEKFGRDGYMRTTDAYKEYFKDEIEKFYVDIEKLTYESAKTILGLN